MADLAGTPRKFVDGERAKAPASRFEAICFDARRTPLADIVDWIGRLDLVQGDDYYIRRVVVLRSARARTIAVPKELRERPDITWIATADPADAPTIYRRHLTEQFEGVLGLFGRRPRK